MKKRDAQRTQIDFSRHELLIDETSNCIIHYLKKPDTICDSVKFINAGGILAVTGDYGNWIFNRGFRPSKDSDLVSDGYWAEKLQIASCQNPYEFDGEATIKHINELRGEYPEHSDYLDELEGMADNHSQIDQYMFEAYDNCPRGFEPEEIPCVKKYTYWLNAVFDAYNECCYRLNPEYQTPVLTTNPNKV